MRCESLIREREAVHTIMEQKIKVLVNSVAQAVGAVLQNSQGGGSAGPALAKVFMQYLTRVLFDEYRMWRPCSDW